MSSDTCYLYHICREQDKGDLTKGYVGISKHPERRFIEHRTKAMSRNKHLYNALKKYSDVVFEVITQGARAAILEIEIWLRPTTNIGWNIAKGGGDAPDCTGYKWTAEQRKNVSGANNQFYGKKHSEESIAKIRNKNHASGSRSYNFGGLKDQTTCTFCGVTDAVQHIARWHNDYCKDNPNGKSRKQAKRTMSTMTCPHCDKVGGGGNMSRYHFDNCKHKEIAS